MRKYFRIGNRTFPLKAESNQWDFRISSCIFHLNKNDEINMMRWCVNEPPEMGRERKAFMDIFYEEICKLPHSWVGNIHCFGESTQFNPPRPKAFKREFLLEHEAQPLPSERNISTLIGLASFSIGALLFFIWDFLLLMGWSTFEWPVVTIILLLIGILMSRRQLVKITVDLSVDSYGFFDWWMIILFICYSLGFAEISRSAKQKTIEEMSFACEGLGSIGGFVSIIASAILFIPCSIWAIYNSWELYKALNAIIFKNTYKI